MLSVKKCANQHYRQRVRVCVPVPRIGILLSPFIEHLVDAHYRGYCLIRVPRLFFLRRGSRLGKRVPQLLRPLALSLSAQCDATTLRQVPPRQSCDDDSKESATWRHPFRTVASETGED
jgi:hypothetical protein